MKTKDISNDWIKEFVKKNKRRPRILHIGNIAENAYQNAKMLNEAGCDCDVICNDYYHIMGCPEWDDADFEGEIKNQFYPDWAQVDLKGYVRPKWFAQGTFQTCYSYLTARRNHDKWKCFLFWTKLEFERKYMSILHSNEKNMFYYSFIVQILNKSKVGMFYVKKYIYLTYRWLYYVLGSIIITTNWFFTDRVKFKNKVKELYVRFFKGIKTSSKEAVLPDENQKLLQPYIELFQSQFPDREAKFGKDALAYIRNVKKWKDLFGYYDIIQGYATSCIWPFLAGVKNYVAYEHGTIRDFPYQDNDMGRLCLLAYANAKVIYLTNIDNVQSAQYISAHSNAKIVCGLHGIDVERLIKKFQNVQWTEEFDGRFGVPTDYKVFFAPARFDYVEEYNGYLKGNEKIIEAAVKLRKEFSNFKIIFINHGGDVSRFKELINKYPEIENNIIWKEPLGKIKLYKTYMQVDAILDQFTLKAFGGIAVEAMCTKNAVLMISKMDESNMNTFFEESMPAFFCDNAEDLYNGMKIVISDNDATKKIAEDAYNWINRYHSKQKIVEKNCLAYSYCDFS